MADETKDLTRQEQLEQWVEMIKECESRPKEMSIDEWCKQHGLSRNVYFYRKREVVKAGLLPEKNKKKKSKSKQKAKESSVVTEVVETIEEPAEIATEPIAEEALEPAMKESIVEEEPEVKEESIIEENPAKEASVTETEKEPVVEESAPVATSTSANTLDITIGSAVIHVNEKTSPELLSKTVQSLVSAMQIK